MNKFIFTISAVFLLSFSVAAQKGVDKQTEKIREEGNKSVPRTGDSNRSFDWGKGKTKTRGKLANPYKMAARRDVLVNAIIQILKDKNIIVDESASRLAEGVIVTQPYVFARGAVITPNELARYAVIPFAQAGWTRGRYTLIIEVQSIDGVQNNVSALAKVEGRAENGLTSEWSTLQSTGVAEDEFMVKLVEDITGTTPDGILDTDNNPLR